MMNSLPWTYVPSAHERQRALRRAAAALLHQASDHLAWLARQLAVQEPRIEPLPGLVLLEFHAEAGAPEGALYVNGRLVGHLQGVRRL